GGLRAAISALAPVPPPARLAPPARLPPGWGPGRRAPPVYNRSRHGPQRLPADLRLPDERAGLRGDPRDALCPGLRADRPGDRCRRDPPEHLLGARARRGARLREDGGAAGPQAREARPRP